MTIKSLITLISTLDHKMINSIAFLYPSDPLQQNKVDECYSSEYFLVKSMGLNAYLIDIENMPYSKIIPSSMHDIIFVYRGWMLSVDSYEQLEQKVNGKLLTSIQAYRNAHYLPNWYENIKQLTISSIITDEQKVYDDFKSFGDRAFIKDYVKSLKTGKGSIVDSMQDIERAIKDMKFFRGFIEGGLVLREVVDLQPNSEVRFFVVHNQIFSPSNDKEKLNLAAMVVQLLAHKDLKFYSIDIATTSDLKNIVIEVGDGQVSDYVGWKIEGFMEVLKCLAAGLSKK